MTTTICLINDSGCSTYSSVHCRSQSVSCRSRSSVEQSSITRHCCTLSPSSALVLNHISLLSFLTLFLTLLSFVQCPCSDSSLVTIIAFTIGMDQDGAPSPVSFPRRSGALQIRVSLGPSSISPIQKIKINSNWRQWED